METLRNLVVFVVIFLIVLTLGIWIGNDMKQEVVDDSTPTQPSSSQSLKVLPPVDDQAQPLEFLLQGSKPDGQTTRGDLQNQSQQNLQPNAKIRDFPAGN